MERNNNDVTVFRSSEQIYALQTQIVFPDWRRSRENHRLFLFNFSQKRTIDRLILEQKCLFYCSKRIYYFCVLGFCVLIWCAPTARRHCKWRTVSEAEVLVALFVFRPKARAACPWQQRGGGKDRGLCSASVVLLVIMVMIMIVLMRIVMKWR